jgi:hypothetical protein
MPPRRLRISPRVVKRAISKYNARGKVDRKTYQATIDIVPHRRFASRRWALTDRPCICLHDDATAVLIEPHPD